jgi:hypothetical protein
VKIKAVKEIWHGLGMAQCRCELEKESTFFSHGVLSELFIEIIWELREDKRVEVFNFWWHWWNNRNNIRISP